MLLGRLCVIGYGSVVNASLTPLGEPNEQSDADSDSDHVIKNIPSFSPPPLPHSPCITFQIHMIDNIKIFLKILKHYIIIYLSFIYILFLYNMNYMYNNQM